jgi:hypothetical protein
MDEEDRRKVGIHRDVEIELLVVPATRNEWNVQLHTLPLTALSCCRVDRDHDC